MVSVLLTNTAINSGNPVTVYCDVITISGDKNNNKTANANGESMSEIHTQSYENPKYVMSGIHFTGTSGTLSFDDVLTLYTQRYNGSNATVLNVTYGDNVVLSGLSGSSDIDVIMDDFSLPISARDSKDGKLPIGRITFTETK